MKQKTSLLLIMILLLFFIVACQNEIDNLEPEYSDLNFTSINSIEVVNGVNGESVLLTDDLTNKTVLSLINENKFTVHKTEDKEGWIIGIRIYADNTLYWFGPDGVNDYKYENGSFFKELLRIILQEQEVQFVRNYYDYHYK